MAGDQGFGVAIRMPTGRTSLQPWRRRGRGAVTEALLPIMIESVGLGELSAEILAQLEMLYADAYHNSHMFENLRADIDDRPEIFRLFLAREADGSSRLVGARAIELKPHSFVEYLGYPPVHGKRFSITPQFRGMGVGKRLVAASTRYAFDDLDLKAVFGESNEIGALSMHGREGALYRLTSISSCSPRNSPIENLAFVREFIANPAFRSYRFPVGDGIQFVYCADEQTAAVFRAHGYASKDELLGDGQPARAMPTAMTGTSFEGR